MSVRVQVCVRACARACARLHAHDVVLRMRLCTCCVCCMCRAFHRDAFPRVSMSCCASPRICARIRTRTCVRLCACALGSACLRACVFILVHAHVHVIACLHGYMHGYMFVCLHVLHVCVGASQHCVGAWMGSCAGACVGAGRVRACALVWFFKAVVAEAQRFQGIIPRVPFMLTLAHVRIHASVRACMRVHL